MTASKSMTTTATPAGSPHFHYRGGELFAEGVALSTLAEKLGTPLYVYSRAALATAWASYQEAIGTHRVLVCFTAVCVSELAAPTSPVFPHIPWVEKIVPAHTNMYSRCTLVTCRGMTATLMNLLTKANALNAVFPLS